MMTGTSWPCLALSPNTHPEVKWIGSQSFGQQPHRRYDHENLSTCHCQTSSKQYAQRSLCLCDTCKIWQLLHSKPALPRFGRQGSRLIFYRVAFHKLINLCFSLLSEVPAHIRALSGETAGIPTTISTRTEILPKIDQSVLISHLVSQSFHMHQPSANSLPKMAPPSLRQAIL